MPVRSRLRSRQRHHAERRNAVPDGWSDHCIHIGRCCGRAVAAGHSPAATEVQHARTKTSRSRSFSPTTAAACSLPSSSAAATAQCSTAKTTRANSTPPRWRLWLAELSGCGSTMSACRRPWLRCCSCWMATACCTAPTTRRRPDGCSTRTAGRSGRSRDWSAISPGPPRSCGPTRCWSASTALTTPSARTTTRATRPTAPTKPADLVEQIRPPPELLRGGRHLHRGAHRVRGRRRAGQRGRARPPQRLAVGADDQRPRRVRAHRRHRRRCCACATAVSTRRSW